MPPISPVVMIFDSSDDSAQWTAELFSNVHVGGTRRSIAVAQPLGKRVRASTPRAVHDGAVEQRHH